MFLHLSLLVIKIVLQTFSPGTLCPEVLLKFTYTLDSLNHLSHALVRLLVGELIQDWVASQGIYPACEKLLRTCFALALTHFSQQSHIEEYDSFLLPGTRTRKCL